jgi:aspartate aminotransferase
LVKELNAIAGVSCLPPDGAFYAFVNIKGVLKGRTSEEFCKELLAKEKMALVPSEGFGIEGYVRWSYATSIEMIQEGVKRFKSFVG